MSDVGSPGQSSPNEIHEETSANNVVSGVGKSGGGALRRPWNANGDSRYVELLLVIDKTIYDENGKDKEKLYNRAKTIANIVNSVRTFLYFNVFTVCFLFSF